MLYEVWTGNVLPPSTVSIPLSRGSVKDSYVSEEHHCFPLKREHLNTSTDVINPSEWEQFSSLFSQHLAECSSVFSSPLSTFSNYNKSKDATESSGREHTLCFGRCLDVKDADKHTVAFSTKWTRCLTLMSSSSWKVLQVPLGITLHFWMPMDPQGICPLISAALI